MVGLARRRRRGAQLRDHVSGGEHGGSGRCTVWSEVELAFLADGSGAYLGHNGNVIGACNEMTVVINEVSCYGDTAGMNVGVIMSFTCFPVLVPHILA